MAGDSKFVSTVSFCTPDRESTRPVVMDMVMGSSEWRGILKSHAGDRGRPLSRGELVVWILNGISYDKPRSARPRTHPHGVPVVSLCGSCGKHYWARTDLETSVLQPMLNFRTYRNSLRRSIQFSDCPRPLGYPCALISLILHFLMFYPV